MACYSAASGWAEAQSGLNEGRMDSCRQARRSCKWNPQAVRRTGVSCPALVPTTSGMWGRGKLLTSSYTRPPTGSSPPPYRRPQWQLYFHRFRWRKTEERTCGNPSGLNWADRFKCVCITVLIYGHFQTIYRNLKKKACQHVTTFCHQY